MPPATAGPPAANARAQLIEVLGPVVAATGYDLDDVTVTAAGRRSVVRVSVDADGGIDLDAIASVSRVVSEALDADTAGGPAFAGPYVLEVSSPGVDRPLTQRRHCRRATARLVQVSVGDESLIGRVGATSEAGVVLEVGGRHREIAWADLGRGRVQVEFNRAGDADGSAEVEGN
jgi:ribosome maturation factor RimP